MREESTMVQPLLQPEILEVVFSHLDGKSLLKASEVCYTWRSVIQHISRVTRVWQHCCVEEIADDTLLDIKTNLYPQLWAAPQEDHALWESIYHCWLQWRNIGLWPCTTKEVYFGSQPCETITCLRVTGSCVVTGHQYGGIHLWDCQQGYLRFITRHRREVTDLGLLYVPGKSLFSDREVDVKHNVVVSTSVDRIIRVSPLFSGVKHDTILRQHAGPTTSVKVYRSLFAVTGDDESLSVWNVTYEDMGREWRLRPILLYFSQDIDNPVDVISLWKGKITGLTMSNYFYCLKGFNDININAEFSGQQRFAEKSSVVLHKYIWRHWICAWLTDHRQLYVSVGEEHVSKQYNTMPALLSYPTSLLLYAELFIMGMESGAIYVYLVRHAEDLLKLDLEAYEWKQSVCSSPILYLDVAEDKTEPIIVASTSQSLFYIPLQPS